MAPVPAWHTNLPIPRLLPHVTVKYGSGSWQLLLLYLSQQVIEWLRGILGKRHYRTCYFTNGAYPSDIILPPALQ